MATKWRRALFARAPTYAALFLLALSNAAFAQAPGASNVSSVPKAGLFIGVGGSYNAVDFHQNLKAVGVSDVYEGPLLVAYGEAGGPAVPFDDTRYTFAPDAQLGYFRRFAGTDWLGGLKFTYKYLGATTAENNDIVPQAGAFTTTGADPTITSFTGHVAIKSLQASFDHELTLIPFIGRSFANSFIYVGGGPVLFRTQARINDAIAFADVNGTEFDMSGAPVSFSNSQWVWGGAVQAGFNYFLSPTWSLDSNYTFAMSDSYKINYSQGFSNVTNGFTTNGTAYIDSKQRVTSQSFTVSINKVF
jgi:hypothetical protein